MGVRPPLPHCISVTSCSGSQQPSLRHSAFCRCRVLRSRRFKVYGSVWMRVTVRFFVEQSNCARLTHCYTHATQTHSQLLFSFQTTNPAAGWRLLTAPTATIYLCSGAPGPAFLKPPLLARSATQSANGTARRIMKLNPWVTCGCLTLPVLNGLCFQTIPHLATRGLHPAVSVRSRVSHPATRCFCILA